MKNAIILHGRGSSPNDYWFPYVKKELEKRGYSVWTPKLPNADRADLMTQLPYVLKNGTFNEETILVGHSSGASLILAILDELKKPIKQAVLVAGFLLRGKPRPDCAVKNEDEYNWKKMKKNVKHIVFINAANDPWGCNDLQGRRMFDYMGGLLIINNDGHMGSDYFNQPYKEFPLIIKLIEANS